MWASGQRRERGLDVVSGQTSKMEPASSWHPAAQPHSNDVPSPDFNNAEAESPVLDPARPTQAVA